MAESSDEESPFFVNNSVLKNIQPNNPRSTRSTRSSAKCTGEEILEKIKTTRKRTASSRGKINVKNKKKTVIDEECDSNHSDPSPAKKRTKRKVGKENNCSSQAKMGKKFERELDDHKPRKPLQVLQKDPEFVSRMSAFYAIQTAKGFAINEQITKDWELFERNRQKRIAEVKKYYKPMQDKKEEDEESAKSTCDGDEERAKSTCDDDNLPAGGDVESEKKKDPNSQDLYDMALDYQRSQKPGIASRSLKMNIMTKTSLDGSSLPSAENTTSKSVSGNAPVGSSFIDEQPTTSFLPTVNSTPQPIVTEKTKRQLTYAGADMVNNSDNKPQQTDFAALLTRQIMEKTKEQSLLNNSQPGLDDNLSIIGAAGFSIGDSLADDDEEEENDSKEPKLIQEDSTDEGSDDTAQIKLQLSPDGSSIDARPHEQIVERIVTKLVDQVNRTPDSPAAGSTDGSQTTDGSPTSSVPSINVSDSTGETLTDAGTLLSHQQARQILQNQKQIISMLSDLQSTGKGKKAFPRERDSKKIDPDIRKNAREGYQHGKVKNMLWDLGKRKNIYSPENKDMTNFIYMYTLGRLKVELTAEIEHDIYAAIKSHYKTTKETKNLTENGKLPAHRKNQAQYERKRNKCDKRKLALNDMPWNTELKSKVMDCLQIPLMSSEDETEDKKAFSVKVYRKHSKDWRKCCHYLDKGAEAKLKTRAKQLMLPRIKSSVLSDKVFKLTENQKWMCKE